MVKDRTRMKDGPHQLCYREYSDIPAVFLLSDLGFGVHSWVTMRVDSQESIGDTYAPFNVNTDI